MSKEETGTILAEYMRRVDAGEAVDVDAICESHPEIAEELRSYVAGAAMVDGLLQKDTSQAGAQQETLKPGAAHATDSELIGQMFGRYKVERQLGEGAMGAVYLAHDTQLDRPVALKIPKVGYGEKDEFLTRFQREAQAAAKLNHPGICSVFDFGEQDGRPYITMAFIDGQPLSRFIGTTQVNQQWIVEVIRQVADALEHAHQGGVVHRDLKAGNVLIDKDGKPVVTDFGLARKVEQNDESRITQEGAILGTPGYMSPEQVEGNQSKIGPATDIYALGVMLFELLTGELPFRGSIHSILAQIARDEPQNPIKLNPDAHPKLCALSLEMMSKEIDKRPSSMQDVVDRLSDWSAEPSPEELTEQKKQVKRQQKLESGKQKVSDLIKRGQYAQAISLLEKMSSITDADAVGYASWARDELKRVKELPKKVREGIPSLVATAKKLVKKHDYGQAAEMLQQIPRELRTPEIQELTDKAIDLQDEVDLLLADLHECVNRKQYDGIDDNVKRLLQLKPKNKFAQDLWEALNTYSKVPVKQRKYRFDERGKLLPKGSAWSGTVVGALLVALLSFGGMTYALTIYLKSGNETLTVKVDDELLANGDITLTFDGKNHVINGPEFRLTVSPGEYGYEVRQGNSIIRNPQQFTVVSDGRNVLEISTSITSETSDHATRVVIDAQLTPLPDGPPGLVKTLDGHTGHVGDIRFTASGATLVSIADVDDGTMKIWDVASGKIRHSINTGTNYVLDVDEQGKHAVVTNNRVPTIYDLESGKLVIKFPAFENYAMTADFSPDGKYLAIHGKMRQGIKVYDVERIAEGKTQLVATFEGGDSGWTNSLRFLPDSEQLLASSAEEEYGIKLFHVPSQKVVRTYVGENGGTASCILPETALAPSGKEFIARSTKTFRLMRYSVSEPKTRGRVPGSATHIEYLPGGAYLVCVDGLMNAPKSLCVRSAKDGATVWQTDLNGLIPKSLTVSPDGRFAAVGIQAQDAAGKLNRSGAAPIQIWRLPKEVWPTLSSPLVNSDSIQPSSLRYVNGKAVNGGNGRSWKTAYNNLQLALEEAEYPEAGISEIWVAKGRYVPEEEAFSVPAGVVLRGGFDGNESQRDQRTIDPTLTSLSADVNNDDKVQFRDNNILFENTDDNLARVMTIEADTLSPLSDERKTVIEGFTIECGAGQFGGGIVARCNSEILNCRFQKNSTDERGRGGAFRATSGNHKISNCEFSLNWARYGGSIAVWDASTINISNCTFQENYSDDDGAAMFIASSRASIRECDFVNNFARDTGSAISIRDFSQSNGASTVDVASSRFINCRCTGGGAIDAARKGLVRIVNCDFRSNVTSGDHQSGAAAGVRVAGSTVDLVGCVFYDQKSVKHGGAVGIAWGNVNVRFCTFAKNASEESSADVFINGGQCQIQHSILWSEGTEVVSANADAKLNVRDSCVRGLSTNGCINRDPKLMNANTGELRLLADSPCLKKATRIDLPEDMLDLDSDGDVTEPLPLDLVGISRLGVNWGAYAAGADQTAVNKTSEPPVVKLTAPAPKFGPANAILNEGNRFAELNSKKNPRLEWQPVPSAAKYIVEHEMLMISSSPLEAFWQPFPNNSKEVGRQTSFDLEIRADNLRRVRVIAVGADGKAKSTSPWLHCCNQLTKISQTTSRLGLTHSEQIMDIETGKRVSLR